MDDPTFTSQLPRESEDWQREGLITAGQRQRILARYGLASPRSGEAGQRGRLASVIGILGALLAGIGAILFVAANWERLDRPHKVLLLLGVLLLSYAAGYLLKYHADHPRLGAAFILLGTVIFGANIFLLAQIYHLRANEPLLLILWAAGALTMAYTAGSRPALYLGLLAIVGWYVLWLADTQLFALGPDAIFGLAAFTPLGLLLFACGELQRTYPRTAAFAPPFARVGLPVALVVFVPFSFAAFWQSLAGQGADAPLPGAERVLATLNFTFAAFAVLALLLAVLAAWRQRFAKPALVAVAGVLALVAACLLVSFRPFTTPEPYALAYNLTLMAGVLWAVILGIWTHRESLVNVGLFFFVVLVTARYFDFFFSLFDRSLVFIGAGLLLLAGGYLLERSRRRLLLAMGERGELLP